MIKKLKIRNCSQLTKALQLFATETEHSDHYHSDKKRHLYYTAVASSLSIF